ncbi:MAG TPA: SGNH/GDSL hydrolase family protein [Candidatus Saccharimonadales bacterium]|nr:SGNH/GDSL hydrolase family protein [Candidatus Saccharimonadales bacterium]
MLNQKRLFTLLGGALIALLLAVFWTIKISNADWGSTWPSGTNLNLQKQADLSSVPRSINGNVDCFPEPQDVCAVSTGYGTANTTGAVSLGGPDEYHPVISNVDSRQHFIPVPNSSEFITYTTDPAIGSYLYFNYSFLGSVKPVDQGLGPFFKVVSSPDGVLADKNGQKLAADYSSMSFSENGEWLVVSEPNVAMLRVNLQTFDVLPFAPSANYLIGLSPAFKTAVTNDGRFAAVASKNNSYFRLYDLATCTQVPESIAGPVNCQYRDLQNFTQQTINGFDGVTNLRFIDDSALSFYAAYTQSTEHKIAKYVLSSGNGTINQQDYLALGDSYISGEGAFHYLPGTDTTDNQCHVSGISYPLLSGQQLNYNSFHSVACSGAQTKDLVDASKTYTGQARPFARRDTLDNQNQTAGILSNFQPGYIDQLDFIKRYQPKVVTVSIGGNDIGFSDRLRQCLGLQTCYKTYEDRLEFVREVNRAFPKLVNAYSKIKSQGAGNARVYIIGYPQIAYIDGDCAVNVHMNHDELVFAQQAIDYLDSVVKAASNRAGVFYVDTQDAFYGHRLCEASEGSVAVNGLTAGNDFPDKFGGPVGRESYHPNDFGHLLLENKILQITHNLTDPMAEPDLLSGPPSETGLSILSAPQSGRDVKQTQYDSGLVPDLVYKNVPVDLNLHTSDHGIEPLANISGEVHSKPTVLGYFIAGDGSLKTTITIPSEVPSGFHTLHLLGINLMGQSVDIFKVIYVAESRDDLEGNGTVDSSQQCVLVEPVGQDFDQDGIDDACDGQISLPPTGPGQSAALAGQVSSLTPGLAVLTTTQSPPEPQSQITFTARSQAVPLKVLAASTTKPLRRPLDQNLRLSPKPFIYGFGILLVISFALSMV